MFSKFPYHLNEIIKDYYLGSEEYWRNKFSQISREINYFIGESPMTKAYYILICERLPLPIYYQIVPSSIPGERKTKKIIIPLSHRSFKLSTSLRISIRRSLNSIVNFCKLYQECGINKNKKEFSLYIRKLIINKYYDPNYPIEPKLNSFITKLIKARSREKNRMKKALIYDKEH